MINKPDSNYPWSWIDIAPAKVIALNQSLMDHHLYYTEDNGKVRPITLQAGDPGFPPGCDCSGESAWVVYHATNGGVLLPDGSVQQHEWVINNKFKLSTVENGGNKDGVVRIAFLPPTSPLGINERHVMLLPGDGLTVESHGGVGPSRRVWADLSFAKYCNVYVLSKPGD